MVVPDRKQRAEQLDAGGLELLCWCWKYILTKRNKPKSYLSCPTLPRAKVLQHTHILRARVRTDRASSPHRSSGELPALERIGAVVVAHVSPGRERGGPPMCTPLFCPCWGPAVGRVRGPERAFATGFGGEWRSSRQCDLDCGCLLFDMP